MPNTRNKPQNSSNPRPQRAIKEAGVNEGMNRIVWGPIDSFVKREPVVQKELEDEVKPQLDQSY